MSRSNGQGRSVSVECEGVLQSSMRSAFALSLSKADVPLSARSGHWPRNSDRDEADPTV
jgi:hypothetical protein